MDISAVAIISASCLSGATLTIRLLFRLLDRRGDRQLFRYVLDKTGSADAFRRYTELRASERRVIIVEEEPASPETARVALRSQRLNR